MRYHSYLLEWLLSKDKNREVLQKMWREGKLCTLLVGMHTGAATMEKLQGTPRFRTNYHKDPAIPLLGILSKENEKYEFEKIYPSLHSLWHYLQ